MPMTFDPNAKPDAIWSTYCPTRYNGGKFKLHATRANAINAFNNHGNAIIYHWQGTWVEVARREHDTAPQHCEACNAPGTPIQYRSSYAPAGKLTGNLIRDTRTRKLLDPLQFQWLCADCRKHFA